MSTRTPARRTDCLAVGIDIGGTSTELVGLDGEVATRSLLVPTRHGAALPEATVRAVRSLVGSAPVERIGVGVPGQVDPASGVVRNAVNLGIGSDGLRLGDLLAGALGAPVRVENDVRAAALGAYRHLPGCAVGVLILLSIGTGVGAGVVIDGRIHRGRDGMAGEVGHMVFDPAGPPCACGLDGCLETLVSGRAIATRWRHGEGAATADLLRAASAGDPVARELAAELTATLARVIQWLVMTYGADVVVVGGGVGRLGAPLLAGVHEQLARFAVRSAVAARALAPERVISAPADLPLGALGAAAAAPSLIGRESHDPRRIPPMQAPGAARERSKSCEGT